MEKFDIDIAIRDKGNCKNQVVGCKDCPIGKQRGYPLYDENKFELCPHRVVFTLAKLAKELIK